jgi:hypothetical protein
MVMKPTNAYKRLRVYYVHSTSMFPVRFRILVAGLREVHCEEYITKHFELMYKCKISRLVHQLKTFYNISFAMHLP